jgi:nucleoside-diphosphate-sugar epimerase
MRIAVIGGTGVVGRHTVSTRPDQSGRVVPGADSIGDLEECATMSLYPRKLIG